MSRLAGLNYSGLFQTSPDACSEVASNGCISKIQSAFDHAKLSLPNGSMLAPSHNNPMEDPQIAEIFVVAIQPWSKIGKRATFQPEMNADLKPIAIRVQGSSEEKLEARPPKKLQAAIFLNSPNHILHARRKNEAYQRTS